MIALLILLLCSLVVGKIHGQETVVLYVTNAQTARTSPLNRRPAAIQDIKRQLEPPPPTRVIGFIVQPAEGEVYKPQSLDGSDFSLLQPTVRPNQPRRTQLVSQSIAENMDRSNNSNTIRTGNSSESAERFTNRDDNEKRTEKPTRPTSLPLPPGNVTSGTSFNNTVSNNGPPLNITFDERASFTGDQCPKGYVKLNGKCVETE